MILIIIIIFFFNFRGENGFCFEFKNGDREMFSCFCGPFLKNECM